VAGTERLPAGDLREQADQILLDAAAAGADLDDLRIIGQAAYEAWRAQRPDDDDDDDDDGYSERYFQVDTTLDNAGRITGDLTPECAAAVQAVLEALGKKRGPEDDRTQPQRFHDALQECCELLIAACGSVDIDCLPAQCWRRVLCCRRSHGFFSCGRCGRVTGMTWTSRSRPE
jgi:hypothetical protein